MKEMEMADRDFSRCDVCGDHLEPDRLHIMIDNGLTIRNTYCCRKHRYVRVDTILGTKGSDHAHDWTTIDPDVRSIDVAVCNNCGAYKYVAIQERTDREIENLAFKFRQGELSPGWE